MKKATRKVLLAVLTALAVLCTALLAGCTKDSYKLSFETGGGTQIAAIEAVEGEDISEKLPADPEREGFAFAGWYLDAECTGPKQTLPTVMPKENRTYYAKWDALTYAELTLAAGNGGVLSETSFQVPVGTKLADFLTDKAPVPEEGLSFGGWFVGGAQIAEGATMPANGLSLTAKYLASYTVNVYEMDALGSYPAQPRTETGSSWYLEPFSYTAGSGFTVDESGEGSRTSSSSLQKNETFTVWLARPVRVGFLPDLTAGSYTGSVEDVECYLSDEIELPDGASYGALENLRFAGWARTENGAVEFLAGETVSSAEICGTKTLVMLHARWETSIDDVFGGSDYFFPSIVKENEVHLRRGPVEFTGTFDPSTGLFSFEEGALEGKVMDGEHYFYFDDLKDKTFTFGGAESEPAEPETLTFGQGDTVVYHSAAGDEKGVYTVDLVTGEFIFEVNGETRFPFSLNSREGDEGTVLVFNRPTSDERGFYAYRGSDGVVDTSRLFFLDGMVDANGFGGFRMYSYSAAEGFGVALRAFYIAEEGGVYSIGVSADGYLQELFKLKPLPYTGKVEDVSLAGAAVLSDGLNGTYTDYENLMDEKLYFDLELDGFGNGTFRGESGTYRVETLSLLVHSGSSGDYEWEDLWIVFRTQSGKETIIRPVPGDIYGDMYYVLDKAPYFEEWQDNPYKVYGSFDPSLPEHASFYHYVDDDVVYVMVWYEDTWTGETVYELFDSGEVTSESGSLIFHSETVGYGFTFYYVFRRDKDGRIEVSIPLGAEQEIHAPYLKDMDSENPEDVLTLDMWGNLHYDGKTYAYGEWEEYLIPAHWIYENMETVNLSVFYLGDDAREVYCLYTENYDEETGDILSVSYYVLASGTVLALEGGDGAVAPFIWFLDDLGKEGVLAISLPDPDGDEYFFFGTVGYDESDGTYSFTPDAETDVEPYIRAREYASYFADGFYFKVSEKDGAAHITDNGDMFSAVNGDGSAFEMDGYGNAVYTPAGGEGIEGAYEVLALTVNEDETEYKLLVSFTAGRTSRYFFIHAVINDDGDAFLITFTEPQGAETGAYYYYSNDGYLYYNDYLVFFGDGTDDAAGTAFFSEYGIAGTYRPTGKTFTYFLTDTEFATYEVAMEGGEPFIVAVSVDPITMQSGTTCRVYMQAVSEEYSFTTDDGEIECDGFIASYRTDDGLYYGYLLIGNYNDGSAYADDFSFDEDPDGKQAEFMALYIEVDGTLYAAEGVVVFDFDEEDRSVLVERDAVSGTYAQFKDGAIGGRRLRLDGHGNATLTDEYGTVIAQGSYAPSGDSATEFLFVSEKLNFRFVLSMYSTREGDYYIYNDSADEKVYVGADLSVLALTGLREVDGSIADATYYTSYGVRYDGVFTLYTDELIRFVSQNATFYFNLKGTTFTVNEEDFIVSGGVLYAYQGPTSVDMLKIPDGVTEIADEVFAFMYYIGGLDLNKVEKIGDYAFYSVRELLATELSSEYLTDIGDYAFTSFLRYEVGDTLYCRSLINSMNLPNVTHIGAYAFYGNTSLSVEPTTVEHGEERPTFDGYGNVKLKAIQFIGEHAFTITRYAEPDRVLYLDLTEVDLSKLQIADNAFDAHPSSQAPESLGAPVHILIGANGAFTFITSLPDSLQGNVEIVGMSEEDTMAGSGWFGFAAEEYLEFSGEKGTFGMNTATRYYFAEGGFFGEWARGELLYSVAESGEVTLYAQTDGWQVFGVVKPEQNCFTLGGTTYFKTGADHTVKLNDGEDTLVFNFNVTFEESYGSIAPDFTVTSVTYNGKPGLEGSGINSYTPTELTFEYADGDYTYLVTADLAEGTAEERVSSFTVYNSEKKACAAFSNLMEDGYYYRLERFELLDGESWTQVGSSAYRVEDGNGGYTYPVTRTLENGDTETYTVVYHKAEGEAAAYLTYTMSVTHTLKKVATKDTAFCADFTYTGDTADDVELTRFYENKDYGGESKYAEEIFGDIKKTEKNTFTVTVNSANGVTVYTVVFHAEGDEAAYIEVTKKEQRVVTVETKHAEGDDYYTIDVTVDENNKIVGVTGEMFVYENYNEYFGYERRSVAMLSLATNVTIENMVVTFEYFGTKYTVTFTYENDAFSATVVSEPAD